MANFANYQEGRAALLVLETPQRALGTKHEAAAAANGDTSAGEPPSSLINTGGARLHPHLPASGHQAAQSREEPLQPLHYFGENQQQESPARKAPALQAREDPAAATGAASSSDAGEDIRKCGYLRKQKHGHKRFFVLRASSHLGPSRLEYYDSEKKFRSSLRAAAAASSAGAVAASPPKRVIYLYQCFTVNRRADAKNKHLIALYTKDEYFAIVAENEQEQEDWYLALSELMNEGKKEHLDADELDDGYGAVTPGTVFKEVWQVNVKPKGLGQTKNLTGVYRLCLSSKTIHLVKLNSDLPCVNLQLMNIRRCGHSESFFFIEVGRSSSIGPGEIWMQVDDSVVAQNMHETILETMKALKAYAEIRPRSKSQSSGSNPIAFITTRRHLGNLPPSQTGLQRRSRTESIVGTPPSAKSSAASGYRFRTSSEGEGTMNRPFRSVTGSLIHLNTARMNLGRQEGGAAAAGGSRYVRQLPGPAYHARSASLPVSHFPSTTSPVSMSSSSGHGSVSDTFTRPSSASICGSPSDGGFNSSDEYGSSPGDFRYFRVRSNTPDSLGNTPPIREEHSLSDYMAMGWHRDAGDEGADEDRAAFRRRTPSFSRAPVYQKMTQTAAASLDETVAEAGSLGSDYSSSSEHSQSLRPGDSEQNPPSDDGYMPMMAGVLAAARDADYMPMQPNARPSSPAAPSSLSSRDQVDAQGYMMMLPGGRASPVQARARSGSGRPESGEYMDMTQSGAAAERQLSHEETPKPYSPYFSLPRSYKAPSRERREHDEYVPMSSPGRPVRTTPAGSSRCPKNEPASQHNGCASPSPLSDQRVARPTRLPLSQRDLRAAAPDDSSSDYIDIEPSDPSGATSSPSRVNQQRPPPSPRHDDYMSLEMRAEGRVPKGQSSRPSLVAPWNPPAYIRPVTSSSDDYTEMTFGRGEPGSPAPGLQHLCVLEQCCVATQVEPKVIRADPQGRRRHSSETFTFTSPGATASPALTPNPSAVNGSRPSEGNKWQSSASFDGAWVCVEASAGTDAVAAGTASSHPGAPDGALACHGVTAGYQNGINYIALDLREESRPGNGPDAPESPTAAATPVPENGAYASIDFTKSKGLTTTTE
ncbi:insulin receptor substrate 2-B [Denticeps clupeoides]|uniref:Uncharacterized protein n=1 Tax=Denticeps clupeoides TaxID=299321 RepID=A0AAY4C1V7_9TELE|nr:insulin receptor substrate 2-B-like [Denticeps clupeoides]